MSVVLKLALDQTMVWMGQGIQEFMDVNLVVEVAVCCLLVLIYVNGNGMLYIIYYLLRMLQTSMWYLSENIFTLK